MEIQIEQLSKENRNHFIDFFKRSNLETTRRNFHPFEFSEEALDKVFSSIHKDLFFGIFGRKNEIFGFGMLRGWDEGYEVPSLGILIAEESRGTGIGGQLLEYLLTVASDRGSKCVRLSVYEDNKRAIHIYNKFGFKITEKLEVSNRVKWIMHCDIS